MMDDGSAINNDNNDVIAIHSTQRELFNNNNDDARQSWIESTVGWIESVVVVESDGSSRVTHCIHASVRYLLLRSLEPAVA
jgi:hypothetical protein